MKDFAECTVLLGIVAVAWVTLYFTGYLVEKFIGLFVPPKEK